MRFWARIFSLNPLSLCSKNHILPFYLFVKQVEKARNSVFTELLKVNEMNVGCDFNYVSARYWKAKRAITKDKVCDWLETTCHILDQYCIPWLQKAAPLAEEVRTLRSEVQKVKAENTSYQKKIINLQKQLIEKQEEQLNLVKSTFEEEVKTYSAVVKSTVESEMKTVSAAVKKSCSVAMAPRKIQAAVKKIADKDERSRNIVIYGQEKRSSLVLKS